MLIISMYNILFIKKWTTEIISY